MDFKTAALVLAQALPGMDADILVKLALAFEDANESPTAAPPDLDDAAALAEWAKTQRAIVLAIDAGKKIHAIKELRELTDSSLLQAKNALDILMPPRSYEY